ncbi:WYL domain-containing protein, partial [Daejeonella sp.]|uniref:WYL domain-containing protein n=1 Tax=Daejeonella sp. TaxID=2805397 RepID=UPI0030C43A00
FYSSLTLFFVNLCQDKSDFSKEHQTLKEYLARYDVDSPEHQSMPLVIIRVNKEKAYWLENQKYYQGFISQIEENEEVEMSFLSSSLQGFARWFMMFGDHATIIQPEALKEEVRKLVLAVSKKMTDDSGTKNQESTCLPVGRDFPQSL